MKLNNDLKKCISYHGHLCPGLLLGYKASLLCLSYLKENRSEDEELVAIVDNSSCFADAVSVITGCTFGKGNFFFRDIGKMSLHLISRKTGKGVRAVLKPGPVKKDEKEKVDLMNKVLSGTASNDEIKKFKKERELRIRELLSQKPEDLFYLSPAYIELPDRAKIFRSQLCNGCGEMVMETRLIEKDGKLVCFECAKKEIELIP